MNFKPSDLFIGVIDFFSVILPGAMVTYYLKGLVYNDIFGPGKILPPLQTPVEKWIAFLIATLIVGNIIFLVASFLLDKLVYDKLLRKPFFEKNSDLAFKAASLIREGYTPTDNWLSRLKSIGRISDLEMQEILDKKSPLINTF